jgi:hypothetical protein
LLILHLCLILDKVPYKRNVSLFNTLFLEKTAVNFDSFRGLIGNRMVMTSLHAQAKLRQ